MIIRFISLFALLITSSLAGTAQTFNETLKYINEKVNERSIVMQQGQKLKWTVSNDGKLTRALYHRSGSTIDISSIYLKELCIKPECIEEENMPPVLQGDSPYLVYTIATPNSKNAKPFRVFLDDTPDSQKVKNAITHLIKLAHSNKSFKQKDPFDY